MQRKEAKAPVDGQPLLCAKPYEKYIDPPGRCFDQRQNGCGPADNWKTSIVPNRAYGPLSWNFLPYCNIHDVCYGTPGMTKSECDSDLRDNLYASCFREHPDHPFRRQNCERIARIYYGVVVSEEGDVAWRKAQGLEGHPPLPEGHPALKALRRSGLYLPRPAPQQDPKIQQRIRAVVEEYKQAGEPSDAPDTPDASAAAEEAEGKSPKR